LAAAIQSTINNREEDVIMALIRWSPKTEMWDPFRGLDELQQEMNRLFDTSLRRVGRGDLEGAFWPAVDVAEEKDGFLVRMDLPGLAKEDVTVTLQDHFLTIKGEKKHETEAKETNYYYRERVHGTFTRTIELPSTVDAKKIDAQFKDGVLSVRLPKTEEAKPKQIDIKVN
jgi:HSP20 family protein